MLATLARTAYRRRRIVVCLWTLLLVLSFTVAPSLAGKWMSSDRLDGTDSQAAYDLLQTAMPTKNGPTSTVVFDGVDEHRNDVDEFLRQAASVPGVVTVDPLRHAAHDDVAIATLTFIDDGTDTTADLRDDAAAALQDKAKALDHRGVRTSFSGYLFEAGGEPSSEMIGMVAALVILIIAFGSVVAAGLPLLVALFGVGIAIPLIQILARVIDMGEVTVQVATMIGIGVGIDYTLLVASRYRTALGRHGNPENAVIEAIDNAGRAVLLAGATVIISLSGMFLIGMKTFNGLAVGTAVAVVVAVGATLTLAPAVLGFIGHNINRLHIGRRRRTSGAPGAALRPNWGTRWAGVVRRHPRSLATTAALGLLVLTIPLGSLHLGRAEEGVAPQGSSNRTAYDTISRAFGAGQHGPILVAVDLRSGVADDVRIVADAFRATPGIVEVSEPTVAPNGTVAVLMAIPTTGPSDRATEALLHHLRDDVVPQVEDRIGAPVHLGGDTASDIDFAERSGSRLPWFVAAVLALSFLLLLVMFRSVVVPLKAVVLNLLSIGAAYGLMVAVFQWRWGAELMGTTGGPVEPWIPPVLFAIVFGLSMDYEIFLLTAIREAHHRQGDTAQAVFTGLNGTARIVTAAAAIMAVVFGSFIAMDELSLKMIGFGLASAILIDATVVRMVLLPAVMTWLGDANWWAPRWLERRLPNISLHSTDTVHEALPTT